MALVRILQAVGGTDFSWAPGDVVPMTKDQVDVWCDGVRAELATDLVVDQAAITAAVETARAEVLVDAEQQRTALLEQRQDQARSIVDDNLPEGLDDALVAELRSLAAEFVAGVEDPSRAAELAVVVAIGEQVSPKLVVPGSSGDGDVAATPTTKEENPVPTSEQSDGTPSAPSTPDTAEAREATPRPERAAKRSRGGGRGEAGPETRG